MHGVAVGEHVRAGRLAVGRGERPRFAEESVGVVNQGSRQLRLAFCSLKDEAIVPLVEALARVCGKM